MNRRMIAPLLIGLGGIAILVSLGVWQLQRLAWKEGILADIETHISDDPSPLPAFGTIPKPYQPVSMEGRIEGPELHVLVSRKEIGAGYRIITAFQADAGRRVLLDRGFVTDEDRDNPRPPETLTVIGNLHVPDDRTSSTPANDHEANVWFARDIPEMAKALDTEPLLVIARSDTGQGVEPLPVTTEGIPNDHLQYAITWFSLAIVWLGMTLYQLWRIRAKTA